MKYTVRFAHLDKLPTWKRGDKIKPGDVIGIMGSSGQSTAAHLHIDCAQGEQTRLYHLADYNTVINPSPWQLLLFIDKDLFGVDPIVTTGYADLAYFMERKKAHHGFDVVPWDRRSTNAHFAIHWNRSMVGTVSLVGYDQAGYGNHIYITFEV